MMIQNSKKISVDLEIITEGCWFGEDDIILERDTRSHSARAITQPTKCYKLPRNIFLNPHRLNDYFDLIRAAFPNIIKKSVKKSYFRLERLENHGDPLTKVIIPDKLIVDKPLKNNDDKPIRLSLGKNAP